MYILNWANNFFSPQRGILKSDWPLCGQNLVIYKWREIKAIRKASIIKILNFPQRLRWPTFPQLYLVILWAKKKQKNKKFCFALYLFPIHLQMHTKMADGPEMLSVLFPSLVLSFPTRIFMSVLFVREFSGFECAYPSLLLLAACGSSSPPLLKRDWKLTYLQGTVISHKPHTASGSLITKEEQPDSAGHHPPFPD